MPSTLIPPPSYLPSLFPSFLLSFFNPSYFRFSLPYFSFFTLFISHFQLSIGCYFSLHLLIFLVMPIRVYPFWNDSIFIGVPLVFHTADPFFHHLAEYPTFRPLYLSLSSSLSNSLSLSHSLPLLSPIRYPRFCNSLNNNFK